MEESSDSIDLQEIANLLERGYGVVFDTNEVHARPVGHSIEIIFRYLDHPYKKFEHNTGRYKIIIDIRSSLYHGKYPSAILKQNIPDIEYFVSFEEESHFKSTSQKSSSEDSDDSWEDQGELSGDSWKGTEPEELPDDSWKDTTHGKIIQHIGNWMKDFRDRDIWQILYLRMQEPDWKESINKITFAGENWSLYKIVLLSKEIIDNNLEYFNGDVKHVNKRYPRKM